MDYADFRASHSQYMAEHVRDHTVRIVEFEGVPEILGYAVVNEFKQTVYWVYVKSPYRRQGLASSLVEDMLYYTCDTKAGRKLALANQLKFNPYLR